MLMVFFFYFEFVKTIFVSAKSQKIIEQSYNQSSRNVFEKSDKNRTIFVVIFVLRRAVSSVLAPYLGHCARKKVKKVDFGNEKTSFGSCRRNSKTENHQKYCF